MHSFTALQFADYCLHSLALMDQLSQMLLRTVARSVLVVVQPLSTPP